MQPRLLPSAWKQICMPSRPEGTRLTVRSSLERRIDHRSTSWISSHLTAYPSAMTETVYVGVTDQHLLKQGGAVHDCLTAVHAAPPVTRVIGLIRDGKAGAAVGAGSGPCHWPFFEPAVLELACRTDHGCQQTLGDNARKGAVRKRSQLTNTRRWARNVGRSEARRPETLWRKRKRASSRASDESGEIGRKLRRSLVPKPISAISTGPAFAQTQAFFAGTRTRRGRRREAWINRAPRQAPSGRVVRAISTTI